MRHFGQDYKVAKINISPFILLSSSSTSPEGQHTQESDGISMKKRVRYKHQNGLLKMQESYRQKSRENEETFFQDNQQAFKRRKNKLINQKMQLLKNRIPKTTPNFIMVKQKNKSQKQSIKIDTTHANNIANNLPMSTNIQRTHFSERLRSIVRKNIISDVKNRKVFNAPIKIFGTQQQRRQTYESSFSQQIDSNEIESGPINPYTKEPYLHNRYQNMDEMVKQRTQQKFHYHTSIDQSYKITMIKLSNSLAKYRKSTVQNNVPEDDYNVETQKMQKNNLTIHIGQIELAKVNRHRRATTESYYPQQANKIQNISKVSQPLKNAWIQDQPSPWQPELTINDPIQFGENAF